MFNPLSASGRTLKRILRFHALVIREETTRYSRERKKEKDRRRGRKRKRATFSSMAVAFIPVYGSRRDSRDHPTSHASFIRGVFPGTKAGGETIE